MPPVRKAKSIKSTKAPDAVALVSEKQTVVSGQLDKKIKKQQKKVVAPRGVVFIKHLPHGFFEEQLKKYFQQFGDVTRLRLARSKRTGGSKSYAFVEFEYPEVAQVAAETMDNYLMFKKVVKAAYIPPEKQRFNYFKTSLQKVKNKAGKEIYVSSKTASIQRRVKQHNEWSDVTYQKRTQVKLNKVIKLNEKYAHLGIDFSNILVEPKKLTAEEKAQKVAANDEKKIEAEGSSKPKTSDGKRKATSKDVPLQNQKQTSKLKKSKHNVGLEDLLGNTIIDDSEDEDYIAMQQSSDDNEDVEVTSDEETYGFTKDSDSDEQEDYDKEHDFVAYRKNSKVQRKLVKPSSTDPFEHLIKRKPHVGGIQKFNKKSTKPQFAKSTKNTALLSAAKEVAKPLSSVLKNKIKQKTKMEKNQKI